MFDLIPMNRGTKSLSSYFDELEKSFLGGMPASFAAVKTDIIDKGDQYLLQAELPGFKKEDIKIDLSGDYMTISAQRSLEKEEKDGEDRVIRRERSQSSFTRSFHIADVDSDRITAKYENGVLEMALPKKDSSVSANRQIEIQ